MATSSAYPAGYGPPGGVASSSYTAYEYIPPGATGAGLGAGQATGETPQYAAQPATAAPLATSTDLTKAPYGGTTAAGTTTTTGTGTGTGRSLAAESAAYGRTAVGPGAGPGGSKTLGRFYEDTMWMKVFYVVFAILVPPITVGIKTGDPCETGLNVLWWILGWFPAVIHALLVTFSPTRCSCAPDLALEPPPGEKIQARSAARRVGSGGRDTAAGAYGTAMGGTSGYGTGAGTTTGYGTGAGTTTGYGTGAGTTTGYGTGAGTTTGYGTGAGTTTGYGTGAGTTTGYGTTGYGTTGYGTTERPVLASNSGAGTGTYASGYDALAKAPAPAPTAESSVPMSGTSGLRERF